MGLLRCILALSVITYHAGAIFGYKGINGLMAVHVFFIISGFYMALILNSKYKYIIHPFFTFISNRFLRIFPIYWITLFLLIYIDFSQIQSANLLNIIIAIPYSLKQYLLHFGWFGALSDITLFLRTDYFTIDMFRTGFPLNGPAWSLLVEFLFYIIAPFLVLIKKRYLLILMFGSMILYYGILRYHFFIHDYYVQTFFPPANLFFFILGILSFNLYTWFKQSSYNKQLASVISSMFLAFILLWQFIPPVYLRHILLNEWFTYFSIPFFLPILFDFLSKYSINSFFANLSYPLYICHGVVIEFLQTLLHYKIGSTFFSLYATLISILVAIILIYLVEKPLDYWRQKRIKKL